MESISQSSRNCAIPPTTSSISPKLLLDRHPELQISQDEYNINVTANFGEKLDARTTWQLIREHNGAEKPAHLYFHVPLCSYICKFCNYVKKLAPKGDRLEAALDRWTALLIDESSRYIADVPWISGARIESLFIGGGTASLLQAPHLNRLMAHVRANYQLASNCELTIEGNPDNFQCDEAKMATDAGFNRFSIGVQSLDARVNAFAGRGHDSDSSLRAIEKLIATDCPFNVDMMFGLPYQTIESVASDVETLIQLGVPTITIYRLRNVERHKMGIGNQAAWNVEKVRRHLHDDGKFPSLEVTYAMRAAIVSVLLQHNYRPSPCGWWSAPGTYPDGNIPQVSRNKWQNYDTMVAFGPGAYGWLGGDRADPVQIHNNSDIASYECQMGASSAPPLSFGRHLLAHEAVAAVLGFAFKAHQPIHVASFRKRYGVDLYSDEPYAEAVENLVSRGFLDRSVSSPDILFPTLAGETLHEEIISVMIHQRIGKFSATVCNR